MDEPTFADEMRRENELLRRRLVHATRPRGPLTMQEAADLAERMEGAPTTPPPNAGTPTAP